MPALSSHACDHTKTFQVFNIRKEVSTTIELNKPWKKSAIASLLLLRTPCI